jgi:TetR/AcrR family transcriptional repressor of nem operon
MARPSDARQRLLNAALDLIWTNSYGTVGVDLICERADVRKGSFYHFFPSKVDLALAAIEAHWESKRSEWDRIFSPLTPPLDRLAGWCRQIYQSQRELFERLGHVPGCPFVNLGCELSTQEEQIRAKTQQMMEHGLRYLQSAIADGQREGMIRTGDPKTLAQSIACCAMGTILQAKVQNNPELLQDLTSAVFRLVGAAEAVAA